MNTDTSLEGFKILGWARVYAAVQPPHSRNLRHGTWYPIVRDNFPDRVSLKIGDQLVDVPRPLLEIRDKRPPHFTIVNNVGARPDPSDTLGKRYLVCPACGKRAELRGHPDVAWCNECKYKGDVGWWD